MNNENQAGCLAIGDGVTLSGTFTAPGVVFVSGKVDGELTAKEIFVGATGILKGKITADVVDVQGEIHQDLIANKNLLIRSSGKVIGNVSYSELEIEKGGDIEGTLNKLESSSHF